MVVSIIGATNYDFKQKVRRFMKYVKQFGIIIMISFVGEVLNYLIPIPVPASIYGMVIMLVLLTSGKLKLESVRDTAIFLIEVMPLMFLFRQQLGLSFPGVQSRAE